VKRPAWMGLPRAERAARQAQVRREVEETYRAGGEEAERLHRSFGSPVQKAANDLNTILTVVLLSVLAAVLLVGGLALLFDQVG